LTEKTAVSSQGLDMKVPGSDGNDSKVKLLKDARGSEQAVARKVGADVKAAEQPEEAAKAASKDSDSVKVSSLAALLKSELDPTKLAAERRQKVEDLKKQIRDGTYQPPLSELARSVSEELSFEILLGGSSTGNDNQDSENGLL